MKMIKNQRRNKLRILVVGQKPPPHHGSNVMTKMFIDSLENLGHEVTITEKKFSKRYEDVEKVTLSKILKIPLITLNLLSQLINNKYDFCFFFLSLYPPSIFFDAALLFILKKFRIKYVLYLHAKGISKIAETIKNPILLFFVKKAISSSFGGIVLGESLKKDLKDLIPNEYLFVLPNAIPDIRLRINNKQNEKIKSVKVLYLSNIRPSKGSYEYLKMAYNVNKADKNVVFYFAGPFISLKYYKELTSYICERKLNDYIIITGAVYGDDKENLFSKCDIFVFPTHNEAFGLVNLEAMRAGLPVVASTEGCIPEIVIDGVNGFIVNPKNVDILTERVLRLVRDKELRLTMGQSGRQIYKEKFTTDAYQGRLEEGLNFFLNLKKNH